MPQAPSSMIIGMITRAPMRRKEEQEGVLIPGVYERVRSYPTGQSPWQWGMLPIRSMDRPIPAE